MNQSSEKVQDVERGRRLKEERMRLKLSQTAFAAAAGVSKGSQILYEKGSAPPADYMVAINEIGADMMYVLTGKRVEDVEPRVGTKVRDLSGTVIREYRGDDVGWVDLRRERAVMAIDRASARLTQALSRGTRDSENATTDGAVEIEEASDAFQTDGEQDRSARNPGSVAEFVALPQYDVHASAGLGVPIGPEVQFGAIAFDRRFLRDRGAQPDHCSIITASGDSMQPAIPDGSLLVVDHSQTEVKNGLIMVINVGDDLLVKRIRRRLDGLIELISDNPAYAPETLGPDAMQQLRIVGRVVYFCRTP